MIPDPGSSPRWSASQARRCAASGSRITPRLRLSRSRAAQHQCVGARARAELLGDVRRHARVGRRCGREDRHTGGKLRQHAAQPAVVGPEVVAPVGDAVRLVHHQQPGRRGEPGQHLLPEAQGVEPLGDTSRTSTRPPAISSWISSHSSGFDELIVRAWIPALTADSTWLRMSASSGETMTVGLRARRPQQRRGDEVHRRLAPTGALHHQGPSAVRDQRLDRPPLVLAQPGRAGGVTDQAGEHGIGGRAEIFPAACGPCLTWNSTGLTTGERTGRRAAGHPPSVRCQALWTADTPRPQGFSTGVDGRSGTRDRHAMNERHDDITGPDDTAPADGEGTADDCGTVEATGMRGGTGQGAASTPGRPAGDRGTAAATDVPGGAGDGRGAAGPVSPPDRAGQEAEGPDRSLFAQGPQLTLRGPRSWPTLCRTCSDSTPPTAWCCWPCTASAAGSAGGSGWASPLLTRVGARRGAARRVPGGRQ